MFKISSFIGVAFILAVCSGQSFAKDDRWFFTAEEIANAYRYQQQFGASAQPLGASNMFPGQKGLRRVIPR